MDAAPANATALKYAHQDWMLANEERICAAIEIPLRAHYEPYELIRTNTYPAIAPDAAGYEEAFTVMLRAAMAKRMQTELAQHLAQRKEYACAQRLASNAKFAAGPAPSARQLPARGAKGARA